MMNWTDDLERLKHLTFAGDRAAYGVLLRELYRKGGAQAVIESTQKIGPDCAVVSFLRDMGFSVAWGCGRRGDSLPLVSVFGCDCISKTPPTFPVYATFQDLDFKALTRRTDDTDRLWACDCLEAKVNLWSPLDPPEVDPAALNVSCIDILIQEHGQHPEQVKSWLFAARAFARDPGLRPRPHYAHRLAIIKGERHFNNVILQVIDILVNDPTYGRGQGDFVSSLVPNWLGSSLIRYRQAYIGKIPGLRDAWKIMGMQSPQMQGVERNICDTFSNLMIPYLLGQWT